MPLSAQQYRSLRRRHKHQILLNDYEIDAFNKYCKKFKVNNKSKLIREALFTKVLRSLEDDYPTLFDKDELARMEKR